MSASKRELAWNIDTMLVTEETSQPEMSLLKAELYKNM
jgi:hypothetical protein